MSSAALKVGILGTGWMAGNHARNFMTLDSVSVTAVCGRRKESAEQFGIANNLESTAYDDFGKMLDTEPLDILCICLPPHAHKGQTEAAAARGIHLFLEKPVAYDLTAALRMAASISQAGIHCQAGFHMRFGSAVRKLKELVEQGKTGEPTLFDGRWDCRMHLNPDGWWGKAEKCRSQVFEQVIHIYDAACHLFGDPRQVSAFTANRGHRNLEWYTMEDTSASTIQFSNGAIGSITGSNCAVPNEFNPTFLAVYENLTVRFQDANKAEFVYTDRDPVEREMVDDPADYYRDELVAFIETIRKGAANRCSFPDALRAHSLVEGVMLSAEQGGKPVDVQELLNKI